MIRIDPDPERLALYGVTLQQLAAKVAGANSAFPAGRVRDDGEQIDAGRRRDPAEPPTRSATCCVTTRDDRPVYVRDVADVGLRHRDAATRWSRRSQGRRRGCSGFAVGDRSPSPSAPAPTPSSSPSAILHRVEQLQRQLIPADIDVEVTRNYGETANEKANELLFHLGLATISIIAAGRLRHRLARGAVVVAIVIPATILLTLFASWLMGYTLNRVSLFALIFSIGILVDDAIVVIENIARHWAMGDGRDRRPGRDRGGGRGRQPHHRRDAHRRRRAAADALRLRHDGPLHEPDPGQRLGGDDLLLLRRRHP